MQERGLEELHAEVEAFTLDEYLPALARGSSLDSARPREVAGHVARYAGLSTEVVLDQNLFGPVHPWQGRGEVDVGSRLRRAMAQNPFLHVMVQSG